MIAPRASLDTIANEIEILVLRHQLAVPQRRTPQPQISRIDRAVIAALGRLLPARRRRGLLVTPATILRWHRQLVRRRWTTPHPRPGPAIPAGVRALVGRLATENPTWGTGACTANSQASATRLSTRSPCTGSTRSSSSNTHHFSCAEGGPIRTAGRPIDDVLAALVARMARRIRAGAPRWDVRDGTGPRRGRRGRRTRFGARCRPALVADASVMPTIPSAGTNVPTIVVRADRGMADRVTKRARRKASSDPGGGSP